jgi:hypothetical protein
MLNNNNKEKMILGPKRLKSRQPEIRFSRDSRKKRSAEELIMNTLRTSETNCIYKRLRSLPKEENKMILRSVRESDKSY